MAGTDGLSMVTLGRVVGLYGVRGWLRVYSYTQPKDNLLAYGQWWLAGDKLEAAFTVEASSVQGKGLVAKLQGMDDRDQARAWLCSGIRIPRQELPEPARGEYYWVDLIGLQVVTRDGMELGELDHMLETGANDVMVVMGERERLIPFVLEHVVTQVDLQQGVVEVDWNPEF